ncbi:MAG: hypothetical protein CMH83_00190 [Nocardioides sp.]|nr:hypothetical protein [Nocardioides sp.]
MRAYDQTRPSRQARGYDAAHEAKRKQLAPIVATGCVKCWRCGRYIAATEPWDLGHDDRDRSITRGPEHRGCNRATSGRR